jgi:AcrR family transcriptional regulator
VRQITGFAGARAGRIPDCHVRRRSIIRAVTPKTTSGERTQFRGDSLETRNKIRAAAARTIARRGIRGLRVEEVAAPAGVATSLLYYHFRSRSGLVNAAFGSYTAHAQTSPHTSTLVSCAR